ncbi:MAG TPA: hypothetical protein VHH34_09850 [Pseudonocardiaceae bacterium]|nr:hypothetical protein [Pseudonocardiaceae bacterium]
MSMVAVPAQLAPLAGPLDLLGVALLTPGLAALVYGLYRTGDAGGAGTASVLVPLAVVVAVLDLRLFTGRPFGAAAALKLPHPDVDLRGDPAGCAGNAGRRKFRHAGRR